MNGRGLDHLLNMFFMISPSAYPDEVWQHIDLDLSCLTP